MGIIHILNESSNRLLRHRSSIINRVYQENQQTNNRTSVPIIEKEIEYAEKEEFDNRGSFPIILLRAGDTPSTIATKIMNASILCPNISANQDTTIAVNIELHGAEDEFILYPFPYSRARITTLSKAEVYDQLFSVLTVLGYKNITIIDTSCKTPDSVTMASDQMINTNKKTLELLKRPHTAALNFDTLEIHEQHSTEHQNVVLTFLDPEGYGSMFQIKAKDGYHVRTLADIVYPALMKCKGCVYCIYDYISTICESLNLHMTAKSVKEDAKLIDKYKASMVTLMSDKIKTNFGIHSLYPTLQPTPTIPPATDLSYEQRVKTILDGRFADLRYPCTCGANHMIPEVV